MQLSILQQNRPIADISHPDIDPLKIQTLQREGGSTTEYADSGPRVFSTAKNISEDTGAKV
jgi:hypothetical protein